jgi:hypothetical protein
MLIDAPIDRMNQQTGEFVMSTRDPKQPNRSANEVRDQANADDTVPTNTRKDPDEWVTGDESMTGAQASYLDEHLTKAEASKKIDELQSETGRGIDH